MESLKKKKKERTDMKVHEGGTVWEEEGNQ
jgi:hypothetical protein